MIINNLIIIAYYLSVLGYYLGVLIYMLPIPFYGLKKWAPQLMIDSIFSAILIFSYTTILYIIRYISRIIGTDWNAFYLWSAKEIGAIAGTMASLRLIGSALVSMNLKFVSSSIISPLISSLTYLLIFFITLTTLLTALRVYAPTLIAIGLLLHSIPFRLSRSAGAMIISTVIVFSIAAPLMPAFVETVTPSISQQIQCSLNLLSSKIVIRDVFGRAVPYAVIKIYDRRGELLARYLTGPNGEIYVSADKGIPNGTVYWNIVYGPYNYTILMNASRYTWINGTYCLVHVSLPDVAVVTEYVFIKLPTNSRVSISYHNSSSLTMNITSYKKSIFYVIYPNSIIVNITVGSNTTLLTTYSYRWHNITFIIQKYQLYGNTCLSVNTSKWIYTGPPDVTEYPFINHVVKEKISSPSMLIMSITQFIYAIFIGPMVYVVILLSSSYAIARLLGGAEPRIARLIVTGV